MKVLRVLWFSNLLSVKGGGLVKFTLVLKFELNFDLVEIQIRIFGKTFDLVKDKTWAQIFDLTFGLVQIWT